MGSGLEHLSPEEQEALRATFQSQAAELLAAVNAGLLRLEGGGADAQVLPGLERAVHTLKGDAGTFGLEALVRVAHRMEDLLQAAAEGHCALDPDRVRLLFRAADACEQILQGAEEDAAILGTDLEELLLALGAPTEGGKDAAADPAGAGETMALTEYDRLAAAEAEGRGLRAYVLRLALDRRCQMAGAAAFLLLRHLRNIAEILRSEPPLEGPVAAGCAAFTVLAASGLDAGGLERCCLLPGVVASARAVPLADFTAECEVRSAEFEAGAPGMAEPASAAASPPSSPGTPQSALRTPHAAMGSALLVDSRRIDRVMNLVGELVIARSMFFQAFTELQARFPKADFVGRLRDAHRLMERSLSDLQKGVMQIRMVPVDRVFRRLPRLVRDLADASGGAKEVRLVLEGQATELDKAVVDALGEPLGHMIRNAVDHGIEPAAERLRAGKPAAGIVRVAARGEGNQIVLEVADDGRGIDPAQVRRVAAARGLLAADAADRLTDAQALDLIFRPHFSTAAAVTASSGRGIGMDAVRAALEDLKGQIHVASRVGAGTSFTLRLPLTLAIIRGMLFRVAGRLLALPLSCIAEITRVDPAAVRTVDGREVLPLRDRVIALVRLSEALGLPSASGGRGSGAGGRSTQTPEATNGEGEPPRPPGDAGRLYVLVVALADRRIGLVVDGLQGESELVIKALDTEWISRAPVAGGAVLGDGRVVLILDPGALIRQARAGGTAEGPGGSGGGPALAAAGAPGGGARGARHGGRP